MVKLEFLTDEQYKSRCVELHRPMHGNVGAALQWQQEFTEYLVKECSFVACGSDSCILYLKKDAKLKVIMSIHVDDSLCSGSRYNLDELYGGS